MQDSYEVERLRQFVASSGIVDSTLSKNELRFEDSDSVSPLNFKERELTRSDIRLELFSYQRELATEMRLVVGRRGRALLALPTGAGKTRTAVASVLEMFANGDCNSVLWLAPSVELLNQANETFAALWRSYAACPDIVLIRDGLGKFDLRPHVVFSTPQAAHARLEAGKHTRSDWDIIIFDEAHQILAPTYNKSIELLSAGNGETAVIGLSATPGRSDEGETEGLVKLFDRDLLTASILAPRPIEALEDMGVLAKLNFVTVGADFSPALSESKRLVESVHLCKRLASEGGRIMLFAGSVAGSVVLGETLLKVGVRSGTISAVMSRDHRSQMIKAFSNGRLEALVNHRILATGFDCPAVTDVVILSKIGSPVLFEQIVGRASRGPLVGGSKTANIWQFNDHLELHGLPQSYYRYRSFDWS